ETGCQVAELPGYRRQPGNLATLQHGNLATRQPGNLATNHADARTSNPPNKQGGPMRRFLPLLALLVSLPAFAHGHHGMNVNISTDDDEPLTRCDQIRVTYDGERVAVVEESLDTRGVRALTVHASQNGGVYVVPSD